MVQSTRITDTTPKKSEPSETSQERKALKEETPKEVKISKETLLSLAPQMPSKDLVAVEQFLSDNSDVTQAAVDDAPLTGNVWESHKKTLVTMANKGLVKVENNKFKTLSSCNYVCQIPNSQYMLKIPGHINRKENLVWSLGLPWGQQLTEEDYLTKLATQFADSTENDMSNACANTVAKDLNPYLVQDAISHVIDYVGGDGIMPKTYQGVSRMAYWLAAQQFIKQSKISSVVFPDTYLVHIPGRPHDLSDKNYVVVEKVQSKLQDVTALTKEERNDVRQIIEATALFELTNGGLKRDENGKLVMFDLEQPNNSNPKDFFGICDWKKTSDTKAGLESFEESFKGK